MKNGYSWFLGYFISDILCSATLVRIYRVAEIDCCFDNRRIFVALEGPRFTEKERERKSCDVNADIQWFVKILQENFDEKIINVICICSNVDVV